jgi:tetratricopeptide (TPR) repeat protein
LRFRHALIRDAIYDSLSPVRRVSLHRQVGETVEILAELSPDRHVGELAHHFLLAAPVAGDRAVKYTILASRRALARMAFEEAVALYERALDAARLAEPDERLWCELLLGLAEAREWANDVGGSRTCFEEAAAIARTLGANDLFVRAALGVGAVAARKFTATSRYETAPLLIREALRKIEEGDSGAKALLLSRLALHHLSAGARDEASSLSTQAIVLARNGGDQGLLAETLIARHSVLFGPDAMEERRQLAEEVLAIGTSMLRSDIVMRGHALRFTTRFECGDIQGADHDLEQHRLHAERLSDPFDRWANLVWRGARLLLAGEFDEAQTCAERAIELVRNVPGPHCAEVNGPAAYIGQSILILDAATRDLPNGLMATSHIARFPEVPAWQVSGILLHMRANDPESVSLELERLSAHGFRDFDRNGVWLLTMSVISEAIAFVRDRERAALAYPILLPFDGLQGTASLVASWGPVARYLGLLTATLERWPDADRHFADAAQMSRRMGAQPLLAKTLFDHGRMLIEQPQVAALKRGLSLLRQAHALATRLDMPGLLRACEALMVSVNRPDEDASPDSPHGLEQAGNVWMVRYGSKQTPVRNMRGMGYIAELLRHPNRDVLAIDLIQVLNAEVATTFIPAQRGISRRTQGRRGHFTEDVIDAKARRDYKRQLDALEHELSTAEVEGDPERVLELREEIEQLERELSRSTGLRGRARQSSDVERARISVTRAIHLALGRIAESAPEAGATLALCIRTGTWCCYSPDFTTGAAASDAPRTERAARSPA